LFSNTVISDNIIEIKNFYYVMIFLSF